MKIGIMIDRLNVGGVEKSAICEVQAMLELGVDAELIVLSRKSVVEGAHADMLEKIPVVYLDDRLPALLKYTFKFPGFAFFSLFHVTYPFLIPLVMKDNEYDHIVSHGSYTSLTAVFIRWIRKIPYSIYFWDPTNYIIKRVYVGKFPRRMLRFMAFLGRLVDRMLVVNAEKVIVASDTHNKYLERYISEERIHIVHPGTYLGKPSKKKDNCVLMLTMWKEGKHPEYVFELIKALPELKIKMVGGWIGEGFKEKFVSEMNKRKMKNNIELWGEADEEDLKKIYPKAMVQLTTNLEKGFGMPVLEAAACGTVSIVPYGSGVCAVFEHGKEVFYTEERDTKEITKYIKKLLDNPNIAEEMGMRAYERVKKGHTWKAHSRKILRVLEEN